MYGGPSYFRQVCPGLVHMLKHVQHTKTECKLSRRLSRPHEQDKHTLAPSAWARPRVGFFRETPLLAYGMRHINTFQNVAAPVPTVRTSFSCSLLTSSSYMCAVHYLRCRRLVLCIT